MKDAEALMNDGFEPVYTVKGTDPKGPDGKLAYDATGAMQREYKACMEY